MEFLPWKGIVAKNYQIIIKYNHKSLSKYQWKRYVAQGYKLILKCMACRQSRDISQTVEKN